MSSRATMALKALARPVMVIAALLMGSAGDVAERAGGGGERDDQGRGEDAAGAGEGGPVVPEVHDVAASLDHVGGGVCPAHGPKPARQLWAGEGSRGEGEHGQRKEQADDHGQLR